MITEFLVIAALVEVFYYVYQIGTKNDDVFKQRGIKFKKPTFLLGNMTKMIRKQISIVDVMKNLYKDFPGEKLVGFFEFRNYAVIVTDPDIVKYLAVKEFDHFRNRREFIKAENDPLFGNNLAMLKDQKWRDMRSTLSPAFTGSKMRLMCALNVEICEQMVDYLKTEYKQKGPQTYDMKNFFGKLGTDVIGTCAFGIKVDSLRDEKNKFYTSITKMLNFASPFFMIKIFMVMFLPMIVRLLKVTLFPEVERNFLKNIILNNIKVREENHIVRHDMIHLLMEAQKGNLVHNPTEKDSAGFATVEESEIGLTASQKTWTENEIVAQCFIFFLAGFETTSTALSFLIYELVVNQNIQDKLFEEICEVDANLAGKPLNYETLQHLKYLDMVVSESLRKWSPAHAVDRVCTKDITVHYDNGKEYTFRKGEALFIPITAYHYNPEFFPHPDIFDPERFSDENKQFIKPFSYLPFGIGPRNCIGSRFALMTVKSLVYYLVLNFHLEATEKTQIPIQLAKTFIGLGAEKGIHVQFRPRHQE